MASLLIVIDMIRSIFENIVVVSLNSSVKLMTSALSHCVFIFEIGGQNIIIVPVVLI